MCSWGLPPGPHWRCCPAPPQWCSAGSWPPSPGTAGVSACSWWWWRRVWSSGRSSSWRVLAPLLSVYDCWGWSRWPHIYPLAPPPFSSSTDQVTPPHWAQCHHILLITVESGHCCLLKVSIFMKKKKCILSGGHIPDSCWDCLLKDHYVFMKKKKCILFVTNTIINLLECWLFIIPWLGITMKKESWQNSF